MIDKSLKQSTHSSHRWTFWFITLLSLLLTGFSAQAVTYDFPDNLPSTCSPVFFSATVQDFSQYTCNGLVLGASDSITVNATRPNATESVTITSGSAISIGDFAKVNETGSAAMLTFKLAGSLTLGDTGILNANVVSTSTISIAKDSLIGGSIMTTTNTGVVTTAAHSTVGGAISATDGAITVGANSTVHGSITAGIGAVDIGAYSQIDGDINGGLGAVTIGSHAILGLSKPGNITTTDGVVTIATYSIIGFIHTGNGDITVFDHSQVKGAITTIKGTIVIYTFVIVGGNVIVSAGLGNIEIGASSEVCGNVRNEGYGTLTLMAGVQVAGNVYTLQSAITINDGGSVGSYAYIAGDGVMTMTGTLVGGDITTHVGVITLTDTRVRGTVARLGAGGAVVMTRSVDKQVNLVIPGPQYCPADPVIEVTGSTASGLFDCLETGGQTAALYTQLAGTSFTFDIAALKIDKTIENNYVVAGDPPKYTRVELFDDTTPPTSCAAYINPVDVKTVVFNSRLSGRAAPTSAFNLSNVYQKLRCRVTECTDNTCTTVSATAKQSCSSDQFSVRPVAVTLISSANALAPSSTATPIIKAGTLFNLSASTVSGDHYSGVLTLDSNKLTIENPNQDITQPNNGVIGTLTPANLTANITAVNNATYSEVGYLYLASGAYRDDSFTAVDSVNGDCIVDSLSNNLSDSLSGKQYGCSIGNTEALTLGRFIPDHFGVVGAVVTRSELQLTELQKVPFTYMDEPMQLALTVTAYNKSDGATFNYQGTFAKLNTTDWSLSNWLCASVSSMQCMGLSATNGTMPLTDRLAVDIIRLNSKVPGNTTTLGGSINGWSKGSSYFTVNILLKRYINPDLKVNPKGYVSPDGPYDNLKLGAKPLDLDGVTLPPNAASDTRHCVNLDVLTGAENADCMFGMADETNLRRKLIETKVRFGRLNLANAYGSELLNLIIPVEAQYWNGSSFIKNSDDNYTLLTDNNIVVGNYQGDLANAVTLPPTLGSFDVEGRCIINNPKTNGVVSEGKSCILFYKPLVSGSVDVLINLGLTNNVASCLDPLLFSGTSTPADLAYLRNNGCADYYDRDPTAHITWGIYKDNGKGSNGLIYFREVY